MTYSLHLVVHSGTRDYVNMILRMAGRSMSNDKRDECERIAALNEGDIIRVAVSCASRTTFVQEAAWFIADTLRSDVQFDEDYEDQASARHSYIDTVRADVNRVIDHGNWDEDLLSTFEWPYGIHIVMNDEIPSSDINKDVLWFYRPVRPAIDDQ